MAVKSSTVATKMTNVGVVGDAPEGFVRLNGVLWKLKGEFDKDLASQICMIELACKGLDSVFVPLFRYEMYNLG